MSEQSEQAMTHWHRLAIVGAATALVAAIALINYGSVFTPSGVVPFGNDAFYHAARVLDASVGDRGFYQFDPMMHVPEGSWVSWPWGYDYLLSRLVLLQQWLMPASDPMAMLVFLPVAFFAVNASLLLAICGLLGLRIEFRVLAVLGFALLPTTQTQHGLAQIDHHFMELFFVLLVCFLAMRWLRSPSTMSRAVACGVALGIAHIFHHALFILQLPLLLAVGLLWVKGQALPAQALRALAAALFMTTLLVTLPSGPFLDGQFSMTTLSWFHVYIAAASSAFLLAISWLRFSLPAVAGIVMASLLALLPAGAQFGRGADFIGGRMEMLEGILEMESPWAMIIGGYGLEATTGIYSLFVVLVPFLIVFALWRLLRESEPMLLGYLCFATIGLALMLAQYRLNYFGTVFMLSLPWFAIGYVPRLAEMKRGVLAGLATVFFLIGFRPALTGPLFNTYPIGGNVLYETVQPLMPALAKACHEDPGIVLAAGQFGHAIRFHTDCSVIANNFLISDLHFQKVREVNELFSVPAEVLAGSGSPIKYVFVMLADTHELVDGLAVVKSFDDIEQRNPRLIRDLVFGTELPPGVEVLKRIQLEMEDGSLLPLAAVYKLTGSTE